MSKTQTRQVLVPEYMTKFQCIGSDCEDTCCAGWRVDIDKKTYKTYRNLKDKNLKNLVEKSLKRERSNPSDRRYATIKLKEDSSCPLLSDDKLCQIQLKLGGEALSNTCAVYPRVTNIVDNIYERAGTVSCPEVVRLALLNPEPMKLVTIDEPINERHNVHQFIKSQNFPYSTENIRSFSVWLIQNRTYTLEERMILLGVVIEQVTNLIEKKQYEQIKSLIENYKQQLSVQKKIQIRFEVDKQEQIKSQLILLKGMIDHRITQGINSQRYLDCFTEFLQGIQYVQDANLEDVVVHYENAFKDYYNPFMKEHEYILENYVINYMIKNLFPFGDKPSIFDEYIMLSLHYSMIKMQLIGMAGHLKDQFSIDSIIKLIQSFAKTVEHNRLYLDSLFDSLKQKNNAHMTCMAMLIKN